MSGETPQKSLILPPVHILWKHIFTLNTRIYYKNLGNLEDTFWQKSWKMTIFTPGKFCKSKKTLGLQVQRTFL